MNSISNDGIIVGDDGKSRCWWATSDEQYIKYHDTEWGYPVHDDIHLFEKICLEGFQAGLSWLTILRKRENFRRCFDDFDFKKLSLYTEDDVERLMQDASIVRHRGKIQSVINNAKKVPEIIEEFGTLSNYFWTFKPDESSRPVKNTYEEISQITMSDDSKAMSKDLKKRGWSFVGPTTCYAFMQSMGIVNDHLEECHCYQLASQK